MVLGSAEWGDGEGGSGGRAAVPGEEEVGVVGVGPFEDEVPHAGGCIALDDPEGVEGDDELGFLVSGVEMGAQVLAERHPDDDAVEA